MSRITVPFYYCKSRVPFVLFKTNDNETRICIVDTGSELSMFDSSLIGAGIDVIHNDAETSLVGVNGSSEPNKVQTVSGAIRMKAKDKLEYLVEIRGTIYDFKNLTEIFRSRTKKDIIISAILGSDFLKAYNAKINYKDKTLTIDNVEVE